MSLDATFTALADPTRRGVVALLRARPYRAGELADKLGTSAPAMSKHLRVLRTSGLVEHASDSDDARAKIFSLRQKPFRELRDWLEQVERFWENQLDAFAAHAERTRGKKTSR
jgi:DNA-binding transcriptional ArsR family regulator